MRGNGQLPVSEGRCVLLTGNTPVVMPDTGPSFLLRILLSTVRAGYLVLDQAPEAGRRPEL